MNLAIVGSRTYTNYESFKQHMSEYVSIRGSPKQIISGGALGADTLAERYAHENKIPIIIYHAEWNKYGKGAGMLRNTDIVHASTHVIAFPSRTGRGTQDTINKAKKLNKNVEIIWID
jgi:hypothetical protein